MVTANIKGRKTYYDGSMWRYCDNDSPVKTERHCNLYWSIYRLIKKFTTKH